MWRKLVLKRYPNRKLNGSRLWIALIHHSLTNTDILKTWWTNFWHKNYRELSRHTIRLIHMITGKLPLIFIFLSSYTANRRDSCAQNLREMTHDIFADIRHLSFDSGVEASYKRPVLWVKFPSSDKMTVMVYCGIRIIILLPY